MLVIDYGTPESLEIIRQRAGDLAAVLVEPVQSRRPDFAPIEFLKEVRKITERSGTVLIFDEVITGLRSHPRGAQGLFGIEADIASYGKVVGGGFPIGVIGGKRKYMDALDGGHWQYGDDSIPSVGVTYFAGTFVRHPLALAAAKASLLRMKSEGADLQKKLTAKTAGMVSELNAFMSDVGAPLKLNNFASLFRNVFTEDLPYGDLVYVHLRNRGVHILDNFPCFLTTAHTDEDVAFVAARSPSRWARAPTPPLAASRAAPPRRSATIPSPHRRSPERGSARTATARPRGSFRTRAARASTCSIRPRPLESRRHDRAQPCRL
jgi:glutamate-1-semialdehyde aminotransferase